MLDQKKNSSISSFKKEFLHFVKICSIFFIPVIITYAVLEYSVLQIPTSYKLTGEYLHNHAEEVEVIFLGSSQVKNSINPKFLEKKSINLSSTSQHHNTDFKILKQTRDRLINVKTVVLEISYGHFELPHNTKYFWKNNLFLKYYNVNTFDRSTYFKDQFIYLSRPGFFSSQLIQYYFKDSKTYNINEFGFDENNFDGKFKKHNYNDEKLLKTNVKIERKAYLNLFEYNVNYFYKMIEFCKNEGFEIVITSPPIYKSYNELRNPDILRRRDSIVNIISEKYDGIHFFNSENDPEIKTRHFRNENHLNPDGAEFYSKKMSDFLNSID